VAAVAKSLKCPENEIDEEARFSRRPLNVEFPMSESPLARVSQKNTQDNKTDAESSQSFSTFSDPYPTSLAAIAAQSPGVLT